MQKKKFSINVLMNILVVKEKRWYLLAIEIINTTRICTHSPTDRPTKRTQLQKAKSYKKQNRPTKSEIRKKKLTITVHNDRDSKE